MKPLYKSAAELCLAIEKLPASKQQTIVSILAAKVFNMLDRHQRMTNGSVQCPDCNADLQVLLTPVKHNS